MKFASASASRTPSDQQIQEIVAAVKDQFTGATADVGLIFATNHFEDEMGPIARRVRELLGIRILIGCTAEGVIGPVQEHEREPAIALWLAHLPECRLTSFRLTQTELEAIDSEDRLRETLGLSGPQDASFLVLGDPFSVDVSDLLKVFNEHLPGRPIIGGMASGAEAPGQSVLVANDEIIREGAVGIAIGGGAAIQTVVSQGCRPVGRPFVITKAERNIIHSLGGKKPLAVLNAIYAEASEAERKLMQGGVFVGRVINELKDKFQRGDFLIRNLMGADEASGAIAVGDVMRTGATIQFQVRDADTADEDLRSLLETEASGNAAGALLFSCNGRGTRMFKDRDHDVHAMRESLGPIPIAGFFCAGELGPIGGKNFIHGHTASIALFKQTSDPEA